MLRPLFLAAVLLVAGSPAVGQTNLSGTISADTTLTAAGNPHTVTGNVVVAAGVTLTVQPGVEVRFNSGARLAVDGTLTATGATFTSNQATPNRGKSEGALHPVVNEAPVELPVVA